MTSRPVALGEHGQAFADNLRAVRGAKMLTADEVSDRCRRLGHSLTPDQVKDIELGRRRATIDDACFLARAVGVKLNRLVVPSHLMLMPNRVPPAVLTDHKPTLDVIGAPSTSATGSDG